MTTDINAQNRRVNAFRQAPQINAQGGNAPQLHNQNEGPLSNPITSYARPNINYSNPNVAQNRRFTGNIAPPKTQGLGGPVGDIKNADTLGRTGTQSRLGPYAHSLYGNALPILQNYAQNVPAVPGREIAPFNQNQQQAQAGLVNTAAQLGQQVQQIGQNLGQQNQFGNVLQGAVNPGNIANPQALPSFASMANPYAQQAQAATLAPITEALMEQILPGIRSGAITSGGLGGSREAIANDQALTSYARDAAQALAPYSFGLAQQGLQGDISGALQTQNLAQGGNQALLNAATQFAGLAPNIANVQANLQSQGGMLPHQIQNQVGNIQQAHQQQIQDENYNQALAQMQLPYTIATDLAGIAGTIPQGTTRVDSSNKLPSWFEKLNIV